MEDYRLEEEEMAARAYVVTPHRKRRPGFLNAPAQNPPFVPSYIDELRSPYCPERPEVPRPGHFGPFAPADWPPPPWVPQLTPPPSTRNQDTPPLSG